MGYKSSKSWYEMTELEKFIDCCEGIFTENLYGTNHFTEWQLRTIMVCNARLLRRIKL